MNDLEHMTDEEKLAIVAGYAKLVNGLFIALLISITANIIYSCQAL